MAYILKEAKDKKHKFIVYFPNLYTTSRNNLGGFPPREERKKIKFGAYGYSDYTQHKNKERKIRYEKRHYLENWDDINTAGFWSKNLLWNKKTLKSSIKDTEKKYSIKIRF